ncbi:MAG: ferrochelatase [Eggerthellaceae bacterium]
MDIVCAGNRCGVLLVNTGTPSEPKPHAVRKYLARFLMDRRIAPMNRAGWWFVLHLFILPKRGRVSAEKYAKIWTDEGSPFTVAHERLRAGLADAFKREGVDAAVRCGMSYSDPSVLDCVRELKGAGCTRLIVLPLYPQSAYSTTGSVSDSVERALRKARWDVPCAFVDNYHDHTTYVRAIAASIKHAGFQVDSDDKVLFSFHSIPLSDIEAGDTYELQTSASSLQIASELGIDRNRWTIGYQCRFDKGREWLTPYTSDVLDRWAESGDACSSSARTSPSIVWRRSTTSTTSSSRFISTRSGRRAARPVRKLHVRPLPRPQPRAPQGALDVLQPT